MKHNEFQGMLLSSGVHMETPQTAYKDLIRIPTKTLSKTLFKNPVTNAFKDLTNKPPQNHIDVAELKSFCSLYPRPGILHTLKNPYR